MRVDSDLGMEDERDAAHRRERGPLFRSHKRRVEDQKSRHRDTSVVTKEESERVSDETLRRCPWLGWSWGSPRWELETDNETISTGPAPQEVPILRTVGEPGLDKDLLNASESLVEGVVEILEVLEGDSVRDHERRVELASHDVIVEDRLPVGMNGCLSVTLESDTGSGRR